jgi:hypothetical protein
MLKVFGLFFGLSFIFGSQVIASDNGYVGRINSNDVRKFCSTFPNNGFVSSNYTSVTCFTFSTNPVETILARPEQRSYPKGFVCNYKFPFYAGRMTINQKDGVSCLTWGENWQFRGGGGW